MKFNYLRTIKQVAFSASLLLFALSTNPLYANTSSATGSAQEEEKPSKVNQGLSHLSDESKTCASCHKEKTPAIYKHKPINKGVDKCDKLSYYSCKINI